MTKTRLSVELQGGLARIWSTGVGATLPLGSSELALIEMGREIYLIVGEFSWRRLYSDEDFLPADVEGASWELIASCEEFQEAVPEFIPGPNHYPWDAFRAARAAYWEPKNPSMYEIRGVEFEELRKRMLKKIGTSLTILSLDDAANVISGPHEYDAWSIKSRSEFFKARGVHKGDFYCSNVNDEVIDLLCAVESRTPIPIGSDYSQLHDGLANELVYRVELDAFLFKLYLNAKAANAEDEFLALRSLFNFFFGAVHEFDEGKETFITFFSNSLGFEPERLSKWFESEEWAELFLGDMDRCLSGERANWMPPDYITIQIQTSDFDPSFGDLVSGPVVTYAESRKNWERTDFNRVAIEPYLARLRRQASQLSTSNQSKA